MPGVPSFRGCESCRKKKKKCDQAKPSCSRCTHLNIPCLGSGLLRYKFKNYSVALTSTRSPDIQALAQGVPLAPPSNETTMLTSDFLSALQATDVRFDLSIYGGFFYDIPRRLGTNEALDASVRALTTAWPSTYTRQQSREMVNCYTHALKSLRVCLSDPAKAQSANTMCAIYLVTVCQGWIGRRDDHQISHGEAVAYLLNVAVSQNWQGGFETDIIQTLGFIAVMESFMNPKIKLDPRLWTRSTTGLQNSPRKQSDIESLELGTLAKVSALLMDPYLKLPEIHSAYQVMRADCGKMKQAVSAVFPVGLEGLPTTSLPLPLRRLHVRYQTGYGILLMLAITLNATLLTCNPYDQNLVEESDTFVDEVIALAQQASQYRPLGSSATPLYLVAALVVLDGGPKQIEIEKLLAEYESDFESAIWLQMAHKFKVGLGKVKSGLLQALNPLDSL